MNICKKAKGCPRASECIHGNIHGTKGNCGIRGCFFAGDTGKVSCVEYKKKAKKPAAKKTRDYAESRLQAASVKQLSLLGVYVMQIPNGEITDMSKKKFARLVAMGFRKGAWDTLLLERNQNRFFGLEFKQPGEDQLPSQKAFEQVCIANNWPYKIAETVEQSIEAAKEWGLIKNVC